MKNVFCSHVRAVVCGVVVCTGVLFWGCKKEPLEPKVREITLDSFDNYRILFGPDNKHQLLMREVIDARCPLENLNNGGCWGGSKGDVRVTVGLIFYPSVDTILEEFGIYYNFIDITPNRYDANGLGYLTYPDTIGGYSFELESVTPHRETYAYDPFYPYKAQITIRKLGR